MYQAPCAQSYLDSTFATKSTPTSRIYLPPLLFLPRQGNRFFFPASIGRIFLVLFLVCEILEVFVSFLNGHNQRSRPRIYSSRLAISPEPSDPRCRRQGQSWQPIRKACSNVDCMTFTNARGALYLCSLAGGPLVPRGKSTAIHYVSLRRWSGNMGTMGFIRENRRKRHTGELFLVAATIVEQPL